MSQITTAIQSPSVHQSAPHSTLRRLVARHPVTAYLVLAFALAWISLLPVLLSKNGFGLLPIELPIRLFNSLASFIGLALPAFLVTAATEGKAGIQDLLQRCLRWRVGIQWYLIALFGIFVGVIVAVIPIAGVTPLQMIVQKWDLLFTVFLPGVIVPFLLINLPEETGWTSLQARLQARHTPVVASLMVALPFALIHLPAYFVAGWIVDETLSFPDALLSVGVTAVFAIFLRLLIMWLYNGSGGSLLIVGLFHSAFNMMSGRQITPEFVPGVDASTLNLFVVGVTALAAVLVTVFTKGRLGRKPAPH
jgi:uncharacterized protein